MYINLTSRVVSTIKYYDILTFINQFSLKSQNTISFY